MSSRVFEQLLIEQIEIFRSSFSGVSRGTFYDEHAGKLTHAGEFGMYREAICRDFLRFFIPGRLDIGQGFLINARDEVSTQCDIIIYDSNSTPLIQSENRQQFFPIETVCAVGEVKSTVSQNDLKKALGKLANTKALRDGVLGSTIVWQNAPHPYDPEKDFRDQLFTFLICEKFGFGFENLAVDGLYEETLPYRHRHNTILSLQDGFLAYCFDEQTAKLVPWPTIYKEGTNVELDSCVLYADSEHVHIKNFAHYMFLAMSRATIFYPDLAQYMIESSSYSTGHWTK